jgi:hypothetical protein
VIAIIAVIMGLLVGAVQKVRETANSMASANNMRNIGLAITNCSTQNKGKLPPGWGRYRGSSSATAYVHLLPYLDADNEYREYMTLAAPDTVTAMNNALWSIDSRKKKVFLAYNDPANSATDVNLNYFLNNEIFKNSVDFSKGNWIAYPIVSPKGVDQSFRFDKQLTNGTSNSLVAVERTSRFYLVAGSIDLFPQWYKDLLKQGKDMAIIAQWEGTNQNPPEYVGIAIGFETNTDASKPFLNNTPIPPSQIKPAKGTGDLAYLQALQQGGFNSLMADGSVKIISPNVAFEVFKAVSLVTSQANSALLNEWDD